MEKEQNLTQGKVLSSLLRFSFPIILALFLQAMYGAVDLFVVGQFGETADVSGVATGSLLMQTITMVITGLAMGITILVGEAIGKKDENQASKAVGSGICAFVIVGIILTVVMGFSSDMLSSLMHAPTDAFEQTSSYIRICGIGSLFIVAYNVIGAIFRGIGDSKTPLITVAIACVINIVGDLIFVAIFDMGASGAALATVLSQTVSVIISLAIIKKKSLPFAFCKKDIRFNGKYIKKIMMLGSPIALQEVLVGLSFIIIQTVVNSFGINESAGVGVAEKVIQFLMLLGSACMQSISAFVAQNMGAQKPERATKALKQGIIVSVCIGIVMALVSFFFGDVIAGIFNNDIKVIEQAHLYLKVSAIDCVLMPFLFCFLGYFNGCEKTMFVMIQGLVGAFLVRTPIVLFMAYKEGSTLFHIGLGTPIASFIQCLMAIIFFIYLQRKGSKQVNTCME